MTDAPSNIVTLLTYMLDENREARELLVISHAGLADRAIGGWRRIGSVLTTRDRFLAGLGAQYLGENLRRARDHWQQGLGYFAELSASAGADETVRLLAEALRQAGWREVLDELDDDVVPRPRRQAADHLLAVTHRMSECDRLVVGARSQLMLQRMRDDQS